MTVKELKKRLEAFDDAHDVKIRITYDCGCAVTESSIDDIEFKDYACVVSGEEW